MQSIPTVRCARGVERFRQCRYGRKEREFQHVRVDQLRTGGEACAALGVSERDRVALLLLLVERAPGMFPRIKALSMREDIALYFALCARFAWRTRIDVEGDCLGIAAIVVVKRALGASAVDDGDLAVADS